MATQYRLYRELSTLFNSLDSSSNPNNVQNRTVHKLDSNSDTNANFKFAYRYYQHGYPSRRRSLVDDAKFETVKNREAKLSWLLEQRQESIDDTGVSEEEVRPLIFQNYSLI